VVVVILVVVVAIAVIAFVVKGRGGTSESSQGAVAEASAVQRKPMPLVTSFHVNGDTASAAFTVPLGSAEAGQHLIDLLCASAVEYVREKSLEGLPLDGLAHIEVSAMRGDSPEVIGTVDLPDVGVLPEMDASLFVSSADDPIASLAAVVADSSVAKPSGDSSGLAPVNEFIELTGPTEAHLRAIGVDPATMSLDDLVLGLMRISSYDVHVGRTGFTIGEEHGRAGLYGVTRGGKSTVLVTLMHEEGSHPELDERALSEFAVGVAQTKPDQAILVTDKYSPYSMYEMEKRDKRLVFVTRERLQAFVDSFGVR